MVAIEFENKDGEKRVFPLIVRHFKGNWYGIITRAQHTETGEDLVVYKALYGDKKCYTRPIEMFAEKVDKQKYPDVKQTYRFETPQELKEEGIYTKEIDAEHMKAINVLFNYVKY